MSSGSARSLRQERRAAALAERRNRPRHQPTRRRGLGLGGVTGLAVAAGLLLIGALLVLNGPKPVPVSVLRAFAPVGIPASGYVLGNAGAPVTIALYEDFQCPACARWSENIFPGLVRNELAAGTVRIEFHGYAFIGPESRAAGRAAWAAERQGRFWDMWATLYANQGTRENGGAFARERLLAMADSIGLDPARFAADLDSPDAERAVAAGATEAATAGVNSTPSLIINGTPFLGATYPDLAAAIAAAAGS